MSVSVRGRREWGLKKLLEEQENDFKLHMAFSHSLKTTRRQFCRTWGHPYRMHHSDISVQPTSNMKTYLTKAAIYRWCHTMPAMHRWSVETLREAYDMTYPNGTSLFVIKSLMKTFSISHLRIESHIHSHIWPHLRHQRELFWPWWRGLSCLHQASNCKQLNGNDNQFETVPNHYFDVVEFPKKNNKKELSMLLDLSPYILGLYPNLYWLGPVSMGRYS